jgi:hypothetical protein
MQVSIFGPNLRDQSRGDIHVHAEDCADIARIARREPEYATGWSMEAASRVEVCDAVYPPEDFGCEPGCRSTGPAGNRAVAVTGELGGGVQR